MQIDTETKYSSTTAIAESTSRLALFSHPLGWDLSSSPTPSLTSPCPKHSTSISFLLGSSSVTSPFYVTECFDESFLDPYLGQKPLTLS